MTEELLAQCCYQALSATWTQNYTDLSVLRIVYWILVLYRVSYTGIDCILHDMVLAWCHASIISAQLHSQEMSLSTCGCMHKGRQYR